MALSDYLPFDPDEHPSEMSSGSEMDNYIDSIFDAMGWTTWGDAFIDIQDPNFTPDPEYMRGTRYSTPEEAIIDMYERGLLGFTELTYDPDEDFYGIYVEYEESA